MRIDWWNLVCIFIYWRNNIRIEDIIPLMTAVLEMSWIIVWLTEHAHPHTFTFTIHAFEWFFSFNISQWKECGRLPVMWYMCMQCLGYKLFIVVGFPPVLNPSSNLGKCLRCSHGWRRRNGWSHRLNFCIRLCILPHFAETICQGCSSAVTLGKWE